MIASLWAGAIARHDAPARPAGEWPGWRQTQDSTVLREKLAQLQGLGSHLRLAEELVLLKLFVPPHFYGSYLVFGPDGEPVGVLDELGVETLRRARGVSVEDLVTGGGGAPSLARVEAALVLAQLKLLVPGQGSPAELHVIAPDQSGGTRHRGRGAELFIRYFYDYFGGTFFEGSPAIDSPESLLSAIAAYFPAEPGARCLDAGTGSGFYAAALAQRGNLVFACDISATRLSSAVAQPQAPGKIEAVQCNLEGIPLPDASIDFAMCNFVLEHVADPFRVIDELLRLVRPGGTILLAVPSFNVRDTLAAWLHGEPPSLNFEHLRSYGLIPRTHPWCEATVDSLRHLESHGVVLERVQGLFITDGLWEPWASAIGAIAAQLGESFSTTWPWNCLGQQTIIYGRRS
jgi:ubiquinone/menaquinone biosynthesis C-methylase UbiE